MLCTQGPMTSTCWPLAPSPPWCCSAVNASRVPWENMSYHPPEWIIGVRTRGARAIRSTLRQKSSYSRWESTCRSASGGRLLLLHHFSRSDLRKAPPGKKAWW